MTQASSPLLLASHVTVECAGAVLLQDVSLSVYRGETVGVVGESGSGKSTLLRALNVLLPAPCRVAQGDILFDGLNLREASAARLRRIRGRRIAMIHQNPGASLSPIRTVGAQFRETIASHRQTGKQEAERHGLDLFAKLGLPDGERIWRSYPFELSGGMSQRVAVALSMALQPDLILADEPTSALDVTVQAQVAGELLRLRQLSGTGMVLVSHNIGLVSRMADKIAVLYRGRMVEFGAMRDVIRHPLHPYTAGLIGAVPSMDGALPAAIAGEVDSPLPHRPGCGFAGRCGRASGSCTGGDIPVYQGENGHWAMCIHCGKGVGL